MLKIGFKILTLVWCIVLLLLAWGLCRRHLTLALDDSFRLVDYVVASLCMILAFLSFKESRTALIVCFLFALFCITMAVWGFIVKDPTYWPSAYVAGVGTVYVLGKVVEYKLLTKTTMALMGTSILIAGASIVCLSHHRTVLTEQARSHLSENADTLDRYDQGFLIRSDLLDKVVDDYEVFLTGETHGIALNFDLRFDFLLYFYHKANVRYLLIETPPSQAAVMNHFIETGEEVWLNRMYAALKGTFGWTRDSCDYFKRVRQFNQGLPKTERIRCVGVDIEHQPQFALTYLNHLLPSGQIPGVIQADIEHVQAAANASPPNVTNYRLAGVRLSESIANNHAVYQRYLGDNSFVLRLIADNIVAAKDAYENGQQGRFSQIRDAAMYANFLKHYEKLPRGRFYGQFGDAHIFRRPYQHTQWFASLLEQSDSPVSSKVLSIVFDYVSCAQMTKHPNYSTASSATKYRPDIFAAHRKTDPVLFRLIGQDSPFDRINILPGKNQGATTDYIQFLLLVSDSGPAEPFGGW